MVGKYRMNQPFTKVHLFFWANPLDSIYTSAHVSISNLASNSSSTTTVDVLIVKHSFLAGKNRIGFPNMVQSHLFGLVKRRRRSILIYCWVKFCSTSEIAMGWTSFLNDDGYPNIKQALSFS